MGPAASHIQDTVPGKCHPSLDQFTDSSQTVHRQIAVRSHSKLSHNTAAMLLNRLDTKVQLRSNHLVGESACHHSPALQSGVDGYLRPEDATTQQKCVTSQFVRRFAQCHRPHPLIRRAARQKIGPFARASLVLATAVFDVLCNPLLFQITITQHSFGF